MKRILISAIFLLGIIQNSYSDCIRCSNGNCWLSGTKCQKQPNGSGGSHCPGGVYTDDCTCDELAIVPFGGIHTGFELPIFSGPSSVSNSFWLTENNDLYVYSSITKVYKSLGNISNDINGKWYKLEFSEDFQSVKLLTVKIEQSVSGEIIPQTQCNIRLFEL